MNSTAISKKIQYRLFTFKSDLRKPKGKPWNIGDLIENLRKIKIPESFVWKKFKMVNSKALHLPPAELEAVWRMLQRVNTVGFVIATEESIVQRAFDRSSGKRVAVPIQIMPPAGKSNIPGTSVPSFGRAIRKLRQRNLVAVYEREQYREPGERHTVETKSHKQYKNEQISNAYDLRALIILIAKYCRECFPWVFRNFPSSLAGLTILSWPDFWDYASNLSLGPPDTPTNVAVGRS